MQIMSNINAEIQANLSPLLSPEAKIILPSDTEFTQVTARWREFQAPQIALVVQVAVEADVQHTVSLL